MLQMTLELRHVATCCPSEGNSSVLWNRGSGTELLVFFRLNDELSIREGFFAVSEEVF